MNRPYVLFPENNEILFFMDFGFCKNLPSIKLYPLIYENGSALFIGNGYGIIKDNSYGLIGKYGNGAVYVNEDYLPPYVVEFCKQYLLEK